MHLGNKLAAVGGSGDGGWLQRATGTIVARLDSHRQLLFSRIVDVVRANRCVLCHAHGRHQCICPACSADLPWLEQACECCARPLVESAAHCPDCQDAPPLWQSAQALFYFRFPIDRLISALKYHGRLVLADYFGQLLADRLEALPDVIVAVPIHRKRLQQRGYNQTLLLARVIAKRTKRPLRTHELLRVRDTAMQKSLHAEQRHANLLGAFVWHGPSLAGQRVLVVDDVLTSGATAQAISRCLLDAGAERVDIVVIARTLAQ